MAFERLPVTDGFNSQFPEGYPEPGLFNVEMMTDWQIAAMGRALDREASREDAPKLPGPSTEGPGVLLEHLGADLAQLASRNPERGVALLMGLARSDDGGERRLALASCVPLCRTDFLPARDLYLAAQDKILTGIETGTVDVDDYHDLIGSENDMTKVLPRELAHDLSERAYARDPRG